MIIIDGGTIHDNKFLKSNFKRVVLNRKKRVSISNGTVR